MILRNLEGCKLLQRIIRRAPLRSFKTPGNGKVNGVAGSLSPRESVYDSELIGFSQIGL